MPAFNLMAEPIEGWLLILSYVVQMRVRMGKNQLKMAAIERILVCTYKNRTKNSL
ncbi:hypothetical protein [Ammoniphilus sp. YIM 78166]|uniref:hypothetical protein n=1 Tax=Ammoniphilus sp. YIM 78166 TaxID=1644106 RepID=UPI00142F721C|nr:hypothetical protein [Ammoniphilus sp. YIM 78166]